MVNGSAVGVLNAAETVEEVVDDKEDSQKELVNCPSFKDAISAYNYASELLAKQTNVYVLGFGSVSAAGGLGNQAIKTVKKIDKDGNIYCESVSKKTSMFGVNVAEASLFMQDGYISTKNTTNISDSLVANYSGAYNKVSVEKYVSDNKILPWERNYDISTSSIVKSNITFNGKEYKCSLVLNNNAVKRYAQKIKKTSGSNSLPNFTSMTVSFTLDLKGRFKTLSC